MTKKKRKLRKSIKYSLVVLVVAVMFAVAYLMFLKNDRWSEYQSVNTNAKMVSTDSCLIFYPDGFKGTDELITSLCHNDLTEGEVEVYDYELTKDGEYYYLTYDEQNIGYYLDSEFKTPAFDENYNEEAVMMISDYLRYTMKSKKLDYAYTLNFLEKSYYENLDADSYKCQVKGRDLSCYFDEYETEVNIPLKYIGPKIGINITAEKYVKPVFVDPDRKAIALTFDDGPYISDDATNKIIDTLYRYDAQGTFFVLGNRLNEKADLVISASIAQGNEYGSHTMSHADLTSLSSENMVKEVMGVADYFKEHFDYDIKLYRPPYGFYNASVDEAIQLPAVLWELDTNDWSSRNSDKIVSAVTSGIRNHMLVLFHDIYSSTAEALSDKGLIESLIRDGYQLVSVSELAEIRGIELKQGTHFGW